MVAAAWSARYRQAYERSREVAARAALDRDLVACGLTNNVDLVVRLTSELLAGLLAEAPAVAFDGSRQTEAATPAELMTAVAQCVAAGEGSDIPVTREVQEWLLARVDGRRQLGGTGAQAANTLAHLGIPTFAHLTGCSEEQAAAFDVPELVRVLLPNGELGPVSAAANDADPTMWHVALEYLAGVTAEVNGASIVAPASSRIIVSFDPVNAAFAVDQAWVDAVADPSRSIRRVLLSGYSQITQPGALRRLLGETATIAARWRLNRPEVVIHAELGAMPRTEDLAMVVESVGLAVTSIGMNADELRDVTGVWGIRLGGGANVQRTMEAVRHRVWASRLNLHTGDFAASLTSDDPERERDALLFGALVASTRARVGGFPSISDLEGTLDGLVPCPAGLDLLAALGLPDGIDRRGPECFVVVPTVNVPHPAATVGLGDSFTAGALAML